MKEIMQGQLFLAERLIENIMDEFDAVGLIAALVNRKGETLYQRSWGYADGETKREINEDTLFGLASVTKSFTALAIMQLAEKGLLSVHDPVSRYIPDFSGLHQEKVTIKDFLTHSGGFFPLKRILVGDVARELGLCEEEEDFAHSSILAEEGARRVARRLSGLTQKEGLIGYPGEFFSYCNDGYGLLSEIIRKLGPEPSYAAYLEQHILRPLGMERSFCDFVRAARDENVVTLYKAVEGEQRSFNDFYDNAFVLSGGGALKSTLADLKKYLVMYMNRGESAWGSILESHSIAQMTRGYQNYLALENYGYGLAIKQLDNLRVIGHGGSLTGVSSHIAWSDEAGVGVVVLCNTSDVPVGLISDALLRVSNGNSPLDSRNAFKETRWEAAVVEKALGHYESGEGTALRLFLEEDKLAVEVDGKKKLFVPINGHAGLVREKYTDTFLRLHEKSDGEIFALTFGSRMIPRRPEA